MKRKGKSLLQFSFLATLIGLLVATNFARWSHKIRGLEREQALVAHRIQLENARVQSASERALEIVSDPSSERVAEIPPEIAAGLLLRRTKMPSRKWGVAEIPPEIAAGLQQHVQDVSRYEELRRQIELTRPQSVWMPWLMLTDYTAGQVSIASPEDVLLREAATLVRTPIPITHIEPRPTGRDCENHLKVRKKLNPKKYFEFYEKNWTLKGNAGKAASVEIGVETQYFTGLDSFIILQLISARQVIDAYRTDCGIAGDVLIHLGDRTARLGGAIYIITARYQRASEGAKEEKAADTKADKKKAEEKLQASRESIRRGVTILTSPRVGQT